MADPPHRCGPDCCPAATATTRQARQRTTGPPSGRRQPPLYRDYLERALRHPLPLRSEQHGNYLDLFVDAGHLQLLRNPDWQVVCGRRGTGKTFLFGVLQEEASRSLAESRIMSVFVTAQDCLVSPVGREVSDKIRALGYFQTFIELLTTRVIDSVDRLTANPSFLDTLTGRRQHLLDKVLELQYDLLVAPPSRAPRSSPIPPTSCGRARSAAPPAAAPARSGWPGGSASPSRRRRSA